MKTRTTFWEGRPVRRFEAAWFRAAAAAVVQVLLLSLAVGEAVAQPVYKIAVLIGAGSTSAAASAGWQATADFVTAQVFPNGGGRFVVAGYQPFDIGDGMGDLYTNAAAQNFDYYVGQPTYAVCLNRVYQNMRGLAGRVALQKINGVQVEAQCSVGAIISQNVANWYDQRHYIPWAPLGPAANITDLAGRVLAITDPITTPSGNLLVSAVSALGGNIYQDAGMVAICCTANLTDYTTDQLSGRLHLVGGGNGGLSTPGAYIVPPTQRPNPSYIYPSNLNATAYVSDVLFMAMPWALQSLLIPIQLALFNLSTSTCLQCTNPPAAANPYSRWTTAHDLTVMEANFVRTGVLSSGTGTCVKTSSSSSVNAYATVTCGPGQYKLSYAAFLNSCPAVGLNICPTWAVVCICKPCRPVPASAITVTVRASAGSVAVGNSTALASVAANCVKLETCATVRQLDRVVITVTDAYGARLRSLLGLPVPSIITFSYSSDPSSVSAVSAVSAMTLVANGTADGSTGSSWSATLLSPQLGFYLLTILADGVSVDSSPTVIHGVPPTCSGNRVALSDGTCGCATPNGFSAPLDGNCNPLFSAIGLTVGVAGGVVLVVGVVLIVAFARLFHQIAKATVVWRIRKSEIKVSIPPVVLGIGSYGIVLKGSYRGSAVALKRAHRLHEARLVSAPETGAGTGVKSFLSGAASMGSDSDARDLPPSGEASMEIGATSLVLPGLLTVGRVSEEMKEQHLHRLALLYGSDGSGIMAATRPASPMSAPIFSFTNAVAPASAALAIVQSSSADDDGVWLAALSSFQAPPPSGAAQRGSAVVPSTPHRGSATNRGSGFLPNGTGDFRTSGSWRNFCGWGKSTLGTNSRPIRSDFADEIKRTISLRHPKIVSVLGAVVEPNSDPVLVLELMDRGSLLDLLLNETVDLTDFLVPMARDVAEGVSFLHLADPPLLHNDLKAANVLIDAQFSAKISDFGASNSTHAAGTPSHLSPELLRGEMATTASDVYAYGILLFELFSRTEPYVGESLAQVLIEVADTKLSPPKRPWGPSVRPPLSMCPDFFGALMSRCCDNDPLNRPTFQDILSSLRALEVPGLVDSMLAKAAGHKATEGLLHSVFPPRVAAALAAGRQVEPETYDSVTIFFSDIVGFTDISCSLPPEKVMNMLNRLYLAFDQLTLVHGLFKVETIGDAYMVVGNVPVAGQPWPCPTHTAQVARFALEAITAANQISVLEDDDSRGVVHIRAGFHVGPVVASVVGKANPRYCLFGDTVNTASRMESNSVKDRINVSSAAAAMVRAQAPDLAGHLEPRGIIKVKGKGPISCYFLCQDALSPEQLRSVHDSLKFGPPSTPTRQTSKESAYVTGRISWTPGELLGKGAFGRVYLGMNTASGEFLAVKIIDYALMLSPAAPPAAPAGHAARGLLTLGAPQFVPAAVGQSATAPSRWIDELEAEIALCRTLEHSNVVKYISCQREASGNEAAELPCVAIFMEYCPGGSLASVLAKFGAVTEEVAKKYTRDILSGLAYLHGQRVVHRDLKGANVMLTRSGSVKIGDLGAAKRLSLPGDPLGRQPAVQPGGRPTARRPSTLLPLAEEMPPGPSSAALPGLDSLAELSMRGSICWMSPEILAGKPYGRRTDIWSLGSIVVEMLAGEPPWSELLDGASTPAEAAERILTAMQAGGCPELSAESCEAASSPALQSFLGRCFTMDPTARATAVELLDHKWLTEEPRAHDPEPAAVNLVI